MRFHFGSIPDDFEPGPEWRALREPSSSLVMQCLAFPLGLAMAGAAWFGWERLGLPVMAYMDNDPGLKSFVILALSLVPLILVHELLHALAHPGFGVSDKTLIGGWPKKLIFYAHYHGPRSRNRFLLGLATPFLVITVLPLVLATLGVLPKDWELLAPWFSTCNALCACGDAFGFALVIWQMPSASVMQNKRWRTYWKPVA